MERKKLRSMYLSLQIAKSYKQANKRILREFTHSQNSFFEEQISLRMYNPKSVCK